MTSTTSSSMRSSIGPGGPRGGLHPFAHVAYRDRSVCFAQPRGQFPTKGLQVWGLRGLVQRGGGPTRGQPCEGLVDEASNHLARPKPNARPGVAAHGTTPSVPPAEWRAVHGSIEAVCLLDPVVHAQEGLAWMKAIGVDGWRP